MASKVLGQSIVVVREGHTQADLKQNRCADQDLSTFVTVTEEAGTTAMNPTQTEAAFSHLFTRVEGALSYMLRLILADTLDLMDFPKIVGHIAPAFWNVYPLQCTTPQQYIYSFLVWSMLPFVDWTGTIGGLTMEHEVPMCLRIGRALAELKAVLFTHFAICLRKHR